MLGWSGGILISPFGNALRWIRKLWPVLCRCQLYPSVSSSARCIWFICTLSYPSKIGFYSNMTSVAKLPFRQYHTRLDGFWTRGCYHCVSQRDRFFFFFRFFWIMRRVWFLDCFSTLRFALKLERSRFCIHEHPGWIPICNIPKEGEKKLWIHMTINNTNFCCLRCIIVFERLAFLKKILSPFKFHLLYTFQNNFPL